MNKLLSLLFLLMAPTVWAQPDATYFSLEEALKKKEDVYRLDLSHQKLKSIPPSISQLTNLKRLDLSDNQLSDLPPEIDSLKDLRRLFLDNNQFKKIPKVVFKLKKLKKLYLSGNRITKLSPKIKKLKKLERFEIDNNNIRTLPIELLALKKLIDIKFDKVIFENLPDSFDLRKMNIHAWVFCPKAPDSLEGKPISFYLNHPHVDKLSKLYIQGKYALRADEESCFFIDSIFTKNLETKGFYAFLYFDVSSMDYWGEERLKKTIESKKVDYLLQRTCLYFKGLQNYLTRGYSCLSNYEELGIKELDIIVDNIKKNCPQLLEDEEAFYIKRLNNFLHDSIKRGTIEVEVVFDYNDSIAIKNRRYSYLILCDSTGRKVKYDYMYNIYHNPVFFRDLYSGKYTLLFYDHNSYNRLEKTYKTANPRNYYNYPDQDSARARLDINFVDIHKKLSVIFPYDIGKFEAKPPPPQKTKDELEVVIEEERDYWDPYNPQYSDATKHFKDSCDAHYYKNDSTVLSWFLKKVYYPAKKNKQTTKGNLAFLRTIRKHLKYYAAPQKNKKVREKFPVSGVYRVRYKT